MNNIKIGYIGLGCRGKDLLENIVLAQKEQVVAVCDVYEDRAQEGAKVVEAAGQPTPFVSTDYKELLQTKRSIDHHRNCLGISCRDRSGSHVCR